MIVEGVVTAEAGRIGPSSLVVIQDATAAVVVKIPASVPRPRRGAVLRVAGRLAEPYGQLEVRPVAADLTNRGAGVLPDPLPVSATALGEGVEARLVVLEGILKAPITREAGGDLVLRMVDAAGVPFRARATRASGIPQDVARPGTRLRLVGVVGQRASRRGALDGYRVWIRDAFDVIIVSVPGPVASPKPAPTSRAGGTALEVLPIAAALRAAEGRLRIEGVVTIPASLLDGTGRRMIVQDRTAAVEVLVPSGAKVPRPGTRVMIDGELGTAYGAPRIRAESVAVLGSGALPAPRDLHREPGSADEGELVRVTGRVSHLQRLGDRWRAEVRTTETTIVVAGLAGAGIPAASVAEGSTVAVVGVVRRPHPAASDKRFAVVPRLPADIRAVAAVQGGVTPTEGDGAPAGDAHVPVPGSAGSTVAPTGSVVADADLAALPGVGVLVRVGGLVVGIDGDLVLVDDGTATASLRLAGEAAELVPLLEPGDAVSAVGRVGTGPNGAFVEVDAAADLVRLGDLGETLPLESSSGDAGPDASPATAADPPALPTSTDDLVVVPGTLTPPIAGPGTAGGPLAAGIGVSLVVAGAWVAFLSARRRRARRSLADRISARLAAVAGTPSGRVLDGPRAAIGTAPPAEHESSVRGSA